MLNATYTLGVTPNNKVFTKQFDSPGASTYSVAGLTPNTAFVMNVSHSTTAKSIRTLVSLDKMVGDPATPEVAPIKARVYLNIDRPKFMSAADVKIMISQLKTLVDDTVFQDSLLNGEV